MLDAYKDEFRKIKKEVKDGLQGDQEPLEPMPPEWRRAKVAFGIGTAAALAVCIPDIGVVPFLARSLEASSLSSTLYSGLYISPMLFPKFGKVAEPTRNFINNLYKNALGLERTAQNHAVRGARAVVAFATH